MDFQMEANVEDKFRIREINVSVPWGTLAAVCWGDPCSQPVLMVHGIQDNAGSFDRMLSLLPIGFYYVCLELPGHGKSSSMPNGVTLDFMQYVGVIYRFVKHLSWSRFCYIGHSLGGQLGIYYSAMYPEQVTKLIAIDTIPFFVFSLDDYLEFHKDMTDKMIKLEEKITKSSPPNYTYEQAVEKLIQNRPTPLKREAAEALVKRMLKSGKSGYYFSTDQRLKFGVKSLITSEQNLNCISKIECPVFLVITKLGYNAFQSGGALSCYEPIVKKFQEMQNVTMALVDGYHDVHNNEPEVVAPFICDFLIHQKSSL